MNVPNVAALPMNADGPAAAAVARRRRRLAVGALLAVVTLAAFYPALSAEFVDWDDQVNLVKNAGFRGLSWTHLRWMFGAGVMGHYIPFTWLSFGLDHHVWGMDPRGYHLTNVLLHCASVVTFFAIALRLLHRATTLGESARLLGAAVAALFFAVHPLRAESVAWVTERRDVLSGLFFLLTVLAYLAAQDTATRGRRRLLIAASLVAYVVALGSKSIVMGLPLVLLLLDVYPLRRLEPGLRAFRESRDVLWEKVPYAILGVAGAVVAYLAVQPVITPMGTFPWPGRVAMVLYSLYFYVSRTVLPVALSPLYELPPHVSLLQPRFALAAVAVVALTTVLVLLRKRWPGGLTAWIYYAVILAPVSGIVHAGFQLAHDRYSYLSCLGWAVLLGGAVATLVERRSLQIGTAVRRAAVGATMVWLLTLGWLTWQQVHVWHDSFSLWTNAVDADPTCALCHGNLAAYLLNQNEVQTAILHARIAISLRPDRPRPHAAMGHALLKADRPAEAVPYFERFLRDVPNSAESLTTLGVALLGAGRTAEALAPLRRAVEVEPANLLMRVNYATGFVHLGDRAAAIEQYERALAIDPHFPPARYGLAWAHLRFGDRHAARLHLARLRPLDPALATKLEREIEHGS